MKTTLTKKTRKIVQVLAIALCICSFHSVWALSSHSEINPPTKCTLGVHTSSTPVSCPICTNGTATASVSGGTAPFTYRWNNGDSTASISGLKPGQYSCCVKDANGCYQCSSVTVVDTLKCTLGVHASSTPVSCPICTNGTATASISGGTAPFTYRWNNGDSTASISGLKPGQYTCCVKDANGCYNCSSVNVVDTLKCTLAVSTSSTPVSCPICTNGTATAAISGGTAPFNYRWNNGDSTASISGLRPGRYTCCIKDANGCYNCSSVNVVDTLKCTLAVSTSSTKASCPICTNGTATVSVSGGTAPFTYRWNNGDSTASISGLKPGLYNCCVTDAHGCYSCSCAQVGDSLKCNLVITVTSTKANCPICTNGTATVSVSGGTAPFIYQWSNGDSTASISGLKPGLYNCCVTDAHGCYSCSCAQVGDSLKCNLVITVTSTKANCPICTNGTATVSVSGGTAPFIYQWSNGDSTASISGLKPGMYSCCVTDANGCHNCSCILVGDTMKCTVAVSLTCTRATCLTCTNGSATATASGGKASYIYRWNNGDSTATISNIKTGIYICCVTDSEGCRDCSSIIVRDTSGHFIPSAANGPASTSNNIDATNAVENNTTTGITTVANNEQQLESYPNPNNGSFRITLKGITNDKNVQLTVTNLLGQTVYRDVIAVSNNEILKDVVLQNAINGTYFVKIVTSDTVYNSKIMVTK